MAESKESVKRYYFELEEEEEEYVEVIFKERNLVFATNSTFQSQYPLSTFFSDVC